MSYQHQFWEWFKNQEDELFNYENNQEVIFDMLGSQLGKIDPDLSFEIGPKSDGKREFVISASGIKSAFPAVQKLAAEAPSFERWKITAFRPRRATINTIEFRGTKVSPRDVQFSLLHKGKTAGIYLFIPGYSNENVELKQIGYLLLDEALGEFDVESKVGLIQMFSPETNTSGERYLLSELPERFDKLLQQLE